MKEPQHKSRKVNPKEEENQLIYTFRENNEDEEVEDYIFENTEGSLKGKLQDPNTISADIKEKSIKMNKKDLFPEHDMFSTITRNNKNFEQTLLSLNKEKKEFYNTGK